MYVVTGGKIVCEETVACMTQAAEDVEFEAQMYHHFLPAVRLCQPSQTVSEQFVTAYLPYCGGRSFRHGELQRTRQDILIALLRQPDDRLFVATLFRETE